MKTTRQRILEYIQYRRTAAIEDLSVVLHFTRANIRHHIKQLLEEGLLVEVGKRKSGRRGRPVLLYSLSEHIESHNFDNLASAAMDILFSQDGEKKNQNIKMVASILSQRENITGKTPSKRLLQAVQILNKMNYQARWEAHDDGPRVIFNHCPYAALLPEHPELCQVDTKLLEEMLDSPAILLKVRAKSGPSYLPQCIFSLEKLR
jgi:predicted ArsR family transcriptional regulator